MAAAIRLLTVRSAPIAAPHWHVTATITGLAGLQGLPVLIGVLFVAASAFGLSPIVGSNAFTIAAWQVALSRPGLLSSIVATLISGLGSTIIATALALAAVAWLARDGELVGAGPRRIRALLQAVVAAPPAAFAIGLVFLIAPSGWLVRLSAPLFGFDHPPDYLLPRDPWGIGLLIGLTLKELPFLILAALVALRHLDPRHALDMAQSLGYRPAMAWIKVVLPRLYGLMRLPIVAVLAYALTAVDMATIMGPTAPPTLALLTVDLARDPDISQRLPASALALINAGVIGVAILIWFATEACLRPIWMRWLSNGERALSMVADGALRVTGPAAVVLAVGLAMLALFSLPVWAFAVAWRFPSLLPECCSLDAVTRASASIARPLLNSLLIGGLATIAALVLTIAWLSIERHLGEHARAVARAVIFAPLILPDVAFLLGIETALLAIGLHGDRVTVAWSHLLFVLPYTLFVLSDPWHALDPRYERSALCLGASPWRALIAMRLPLMMPHLALAAALGMAVSMALYLPTFLVGGGRIATLTTEAVALTAGGDRRIVGVYASLQIALVWGGFLLATWLAQMTSHRPARHRPIGPSPC